MHFPSSIQQFAFSFLAGTSLIQDGHQHSWSCTKNQCRKSYDWNCETIVITTSQRLTNSDEDTVTFVGNSGLSVSLSLSLQLSSAIQGLCLSLACPSTVVIRNAIRTVVTILNPQNSLLGGTDNGCKKLAWQMRKPERSLHNNSYPDLKNYLY